MSEFALEYGYELLERIRNGIIENDQLDLIKQVEEEYGYNNFHTDFDIKSELIYDSANYNRTGILKYLIECGYTREMLHIGDMKGLTCLHTAIAKRNFEVAKYLIQTDYTLIHHADNSESRTPLLFALGICIDVNYDNDDEVESILPMIEIIIHFIESDKENKAIYTADNCGRLPIHQAANGGFVDVVVAICNRLSTPTDVFDMINHIDNYINIPINYAIRRGHIDVVVKLVELCNVSSMLASNELISLDKAKSMSSNNILDIDNIISIVNNPALDTYDTIIPNRIIYKYDIDGDLPIHVAIISGQSELVEYFIRLDSSFVNKLDKSNNHGDTSMHKLLCTGNEEHRYIQTIELLVGLGSKMLSIKNRERHTPLHMLAAFENRWWNKIRNVVRTLVILGDNYAECGDYCRKYNKIQPRITEQCRLDTNYRTYFANSLVYRLLLFCR